MKSCDTISLCVNPLTLTTYFTYGNYNSFDGKQFFKFFQINYICINWQSTRSCCSSVWALKYKQQWQVSFAPCAVGKGTFGTCSLTCSVRWASSALGSGSPGPNCSLLKKFPPVSKQPDHVVLHWNYTIVVINFERTSSLFTINTMQKEHHNVESKTIGKEKTSSNKYFHINFFFRYQSKFSRPLPRHTATIFSQTSSGESLKQYTQCKEAPTGKFSKRAKILGEVLISELHDCVTPALKGL